MPLSAGVFALNVTITFDRNLIVGPLDPSNWTGVLTLQNFIATAATVFAPNPNIVQLVIMLVGPNFGTNFVNYAATPADVISNTAKPIPADPFVNFPITLVDAGVDPRGPMPVKISSNSGCKPAENEPAKVDGVESGAGCCPPLRGWLQPACLLQSGGADFIIDSNQRSAR